MDCPVCPRTAIAADAPACPNCGVDLAPLRRVHELGEASVGTVARGARTPMAAHLSWLAAVVVVGIGAAFAGRHSRAENRPEEPSVSVAVGARRDSPDARLAAIHRAIESVEGVVLRDSSGSLTVVFADGQFSSGSATPSPQSTVRLARLATALGQAGLPLSIIVEGHTDDQPVGRRGRWTDNQSLGLARAAAIALAMRASHGLARARWTLESGGSTATPFPNDGPGNRSRNRAALLRIAIDPRPGQP